MTLNVDSNIELREIQLSDASIIFNTIDNQRTYLGEWLPFVATTTGINDIEAFINSVLNPTQDKCDYTFTISYNTNFAGIISLKDTDMQNKKTEIGYWLSQDFQGKGIVSKSVETLCDFAFNEMHLNRIQIKCAVENVKSKQIPERLGFQFEGIERDGELLTGNRYTDLAVYSKLSNDR
ncbi:MAG: N-acetyltransferase [Winogradskyella sp.]|uniref:GNAT family N-acetyltransferase n=1 Tax=Winogradskyella sp. TaxID=1883156 RepID=UPI000F3C62C6|nr:GNAT family protein [Winogradskyella sp.]RNC86384.1 MAG: N-acetyltransferase [Winogradskyella sp.]